MSQIVKLWQLTGLLAGALWGLSAFAQDLSSPAPADAELYFIEPADGATVGGVDRKSLRARFKIV